MVGGPQCRLSGPICGNPASQKPPVTEGCGSDVNPKQTVLTTPRVEWERPGRLLRSGHPSQNPTQFRFSIDRQPTRARICVAFLLGLPNMGVRRLLTTPAIALL